MTAPTSSTSSTYPTPAHLSALEEELFRELSHQLAAGLTTEQIARDLDYQQTYLEQLLVREEFLEFFKTTEPEAFSAWRRVREEEEMDQEVQHFLSSKALHNARALQQLADTGDLKPSDELRAREQLLKMSGKIKEDHTVEVVKISKAHLAALTGTAKELEDS